MPPHAPDPARRPLCGAWRGARATAREGAPAPGARRANVVDRSG